MVYRKFPSSIFLIGRFEELCGSSSGIPRETGTSETGTSEMGTSEMGTSEMGTSEMCTSQMCSLASESVRFSVNVFFTIGP